MFVKHLMEKVTKKEQRKGNNILLFKSFYDDVNVFLLNSEYLKEKKEEEEILADLAKKYRDRAKERRDGGEATGGDALSTLGAYRAVAPDIKS